VAILIGVENKSSGKKRSNKYRTKYPMVNDRCILAKFEKRSRKYVKLTDFTEYLLFSNYIFMP
jgi:hypothetical protein